MPAHAYLTAFRESDHQLERRIKAFLSLKKVAPLDDLRIAVRGGSVILRGSVPTPKHKLIAAQCIRRVAGVASVIDILRVTPSDEGNLLRVQPI